MNKWILKYEHLVKGQFIHTAGETESLNFWQDQLFLYFLIYFLPVSFVVGIPEIYLAIRDGYQTIAIVDTLCLFLLLIITFANKVAIIRRKLFIIITFYLLAIVLINGLGYVGPGVFYLFGVTILITLICPIRFAYRAIIANAVILVAFAAIIKYQLFNCPLNKEYTPDQWLIYSSNLIFVSIVAVALINYIFVWLQQTIVNKDKLQERYKLIFERSPLPMWLFDTNTLMFLDVNQAAINHYGYTKQEFLSMSIKDIRKGDKWEQLEHIVKENRLSGKHYNGIAEHLKKNGETIYVKIESNLLDIEGNIARLVLATDMTEQIETQLGIFTASQKIKESESNLRAIFESSIDGFVLLDSAGKIKLFNSMAGEYIKLSKKAATFKIGGNIFDYVETPRHPFFKNLISKVLNGEVVEYDRRHRENQSTYWIRYTLTPVYEDNLVKGVCITGRDVTARKIYLRAMEDQNKTFREISWMQSHLVRAPLARIMGLTDLLTQSNDEQEREDLLKYLSISSAELDDIIKQITQQSATIMGKYTTNIP